MIRSKTPTVQSSLGYLMQSFEKEHMPQDQDFTDVRPTASIKNPFIKYRDEFARISRNN